MRDADGKEKRRQCNAKDAERDAVRRDGGKAAQGQQEGRPHEGKNHSGRSDGHQGTLEYGRHLTADRAADEQDKGIADGRSQSPEHAARQGDVIRTANESRREH